MGFTGTGPHGSSNDPYRRDHHIKEALKVGDYVILNEVDRPCSRHIAEVNAVYEDGTFDAEYRNIEYDKMKGAFQNRATLVCDFGVDVAEESDGKVVAVPASRDSAARYSDGRPRFWQELS